MENVQTHIFSNRFPAIYISSANTNTYTASLLIGAGSRFEKKETEGISRFYTNLCLQGSKEYPEKNNLASEIDKLGLSFQTKVSPEYTTTGFSCYFDKLIPSLKMLLSIYFQPDISKEKINQEKQLTQQEISYNSENPQISSLDKLTNGIFNQSSLSYNTLGSKESIKGFNKQVIKNFRDQFYVSQNCLLTIIGPEHDFEFKTIDPIIKKLPEGERQYFEPFDFSQTDIIRKETSSMSKMAYLTFGSLCFGRSSNKRVAQSLLINILIKGRNNQRLKKLQKEQFTYSLRPWIKIYSDCGVFLIHSQCNPQHKEAVKQGIKNELTNLYEKQITQDELDIAKAYYKNQLLEKLQESQQLGILISLSAFFNLNEKTPEEIIERIDKVTLTEINEISSQIFNPEALSWYIID